MKLLPEADGVPAFALVVKSVNPVDLTTLVVTAQQEEVLLELYFVGQKQDDCFKGLLSSVHVVAKEKIVSLWREPAIFE